MYRHQWHEISQLTLARAKPERQRACGPVAGLHGRAVEVSIAWGVFVNDLC